MDRMTRERIAHTNRKSAGRRRTPKAGAIRLFPFLVWQGVGDGGSCSERGGDHGGFGDFCVIGTGFARVDGVDVDAVGALGGERDRWIGCRVWWMRS
jgi:hypothetical protein